jgi:hypothetical protein
LNDLFEGKSEGSISNQFERKWKEMNPVEPPGKTYIEEKTAPASPETHGDVARTPTPTLPDEETKDPATAPTPSPEPDTPERSPEYNKAFKKFEIVCRKLHHKTDEDLKNWLHEKVRTQATQNCKINEGI